MVIFHGRCAKNGELAMSAPLLNNIFLSWSLLGSSWAILGLFWAIQGVILWPSWGHLGRSEGYLGPSWGNLGFILGPSSGHVGWYWAHIFKYLIVFLIHIILSEVILHYLIISSLILSEAILYPSPGGDLGVRLAPGEGWFEVVLGILSYIILS